jgi:hypothetical protein
MESAQDFLSSLRREIALNIRDYQDQYSKKYHDLDGIIKKELYAAADPVFSIQAKKRQHLPDQPIQPLHSKNFVLN